MKDEFIKKNWDDCTHVAEKPDFTWKGLNNLLEAERNKSRAEAQVCSICDDKSDLLFCGKCRNCETCEDIVKSNEQHIRADVLKEVLELWMDCVERYGHINMMAVGNAFERVLEELTEKQRISSLQNSPQSSQRSSKLLVKASSTREKDSGDTNSKDKCYCSENVFCNYCWKELNAKLNKEQRKNEKN